MSKTKNGGVVKKAIAFLLALVMVLGGLAIAPRNAVAKGDGETVGYKHERHGLFGPNDTFKIVFDLDAEGNKVDGTEEYVYCVEEGRAPESNGSQAIAGDRRIRTKLADGELDLAMLNYASDHSQPVSYYEYRLTEAAGLKDALAKVLYNGYPNDASGLSSEFSSDEDFFEATQNAIYWTMIYGTADIDGNAGSNYKKGGADKIIKATKAPANYTMYLYSPLQADIDAKNVLQRLINAEFTETASEPKIANTTAKVNDTATSAEIANGSEGTMTDEVTFENLEDGKEYTVVSTLFKDGETFDTQTSTVTGPATSLTVTFNKKITEAGEYKVKTELKDGDTVVNTHNGDLDNASETVIVTVDEASDKGTIKTTVSANGTAASASAAVEVEAGSIKVADTITYENLTGDATYKVDGVLYEVVDGKVDENNPVASSETTECVADANGSGTWEIVISEAVTLEEGKTYVVFETAQLVKDADGNEITDGEVLEHKDATDNAQKIVVKSKDDGSESGNGKISTTVKANDSTSSSSAAARVEYAYLSQAVAVVDTIAYEGLLDGVEYTVNGTLVEVSEAGEVTNESVATATQKLKADGTSGSWELDFGKVTLEPGKKYVVFEKVYAADGDEGATEEKPLTHEDTADIAQTVLTENDKGRVLGENDEPRRALRTTVTAGGKTATAEAPVELTAEEAAKVTTVTDTISYTGLVSGDTYKVTGTLMKVSNGSATPVGDPVTAELVAADGGEGTWALEFPNVKLEPATTYVVFEEAANTDANKAIDTLEHKDVNDKAQTIVVKAAASAPAASTGKVTAVKTGDETHMALWIAILCVALGAVAVLAVARKRNKRA